MVFHIGAAEISVLLLGALGFSAGVLSGFFGVGGGFIVTPALNTLGAPMGLAIGTALAQTLGTSIIGSFKHRKLGNVDFKLGIILVLSMVPAVQVGKDIVLNLTKLGMAGEVVRYVYIVLLTGLGAQMLWSYFKGNSAPGPKSSEHKRFAFNLPPMISLNRSDTGSVSLWILIAIGLGIGVLSGFLGVGGGFILVPILYMLGVPAATAVGTSLFIILLGSGTFGTFTYGLSSDVSIGAAMAMIVGASLGAQIGVRATVHAEVKRFRFLFSVLLLIVAVSVILRQAGTIRGWSFLDSYSPYLLLCAAIGMSLFITGFLLLAIRSNWAGEPVRKIRGLISLSKHIARKAATANLMDADTIFESKDWPYLWRR
jgi:uncharacterized membrane protein YfcA